MKIYKPLWEEGILLSPQHFQQQNRFEEYVISSVIKMGGSFQWGIFSRMLDEKALELGSVKLDTFQLCMPDGTFIDTYLFGSYISSRDLQDIPTEKSQVLVYLGLPRWQNNTSNLADTGDVLGNPRRFTKQFEVVSDIFSSEETELAVERYNLQLRFEFENNENYILCPVTRLIRNERGQFVFDVNYIPPLLTIMASDWLVDYVRRLNGLILSRIDSLSARRRARGADLVDFSVSDSILFWFLHGLNSIFPELEHLSKHPEHHPEDLYRLLIRLLGMLYTFRVDSSVVDVDDYDHYDLYGTFSRLENKIRNLLDEVIPSPVIELSLEHIKTTQWRAQIFDSRIDEKAEFYLSAHSDAISFLDLQRQLPLVSKIGAPDEVERVINTAVIGVPLQLLNQTPPGLPFRMDNVYFKLDKHHPAFKRMMQAQACSIYMPASIARLQLSLYAIVSV
ncbi:type VI secretion system baseplate subunit TssK [Neisseria canis]|nr:type VI secretion system baseplate subunit TssK [Neisseria canis]OSI09237.1 type VI secretion system-associated protein [Neisseria canis]